MSLSIRRLVLIALFSLATLSSLGNLSPTHKAAAWWPPGPYVASASQR